MSSTHTQLRQLIRSLLQEAEVPPPDEPSVAPDEAMGRYAMPRWLSDAAFKLMRNQDKWVNSPGFAGSGAEEMAPANRVLGDLLSVVAGA